DATHAGIHVPDRAVGRDVEATHRRAGERQRDLGDVERVRVDLEEAGPRVAGHPQRALRVELDVVRLRTLRRDLDELDVAGVGVQPTDHVGPLEGEIHPAFLV